jgi:hypothetical protein
VAGEENQSCDAGCRGWLASGEGTQQGHVPAGPHRALPWRSSYTCVPAQAHRVMGCFPLMIKAEQHSLVYFSYCGSRTEEKRRKDPFKIQIESFLHRIYPWSIQADNIVAKHIRTTRKLCFIFSNNVLFPPKTYLSEGFYNSFLCVNNSLAPTRVTIVISSIFSHKHSKCAVNSSPKPSLVLRTLGERSCGGTRQCDLSRKMSSTNNFAGNLTLCSTSISNN